MTHFACSMLKSARIFLISAKNFKAYFSKEYNKNYVFKKAQRFTWQLIAISFKENQEINIQLKFYRINTTEVQILISFCNIQIKREIFQELIFNST